MTRHAPALDGGAAPLAAASWPLWLSMGHRQLSRVRGGLARSSNGQNARAPWNVRRSRNHPPFGVPQPARHGFPACAVFRRALPPLGRAAFPQPAGRRKPASCRPFSCAKMDDLFRNPTLQTAPLFVSRHEGSGVSQPHPSPLGGPLARNCLPRRPIECNLSALALTENRQVSK